MSDDDAIVFEQIITERNAAKQELAVLSGRRVEALVYVAKGMHSGEIAKLMGVSVKTAENHLQRVRDTLGMTTIEAVVLAAKAGIV